MPQGLLITLEGLDGAGKTTQQQSLAEFLQDQGLTCLCTREPGGTELGKHLRHLLLHAPDLDPMTELLLYAADRAEHVAQVIRPALNSGIIVICDRFIDSTLAYQGYGRNLSQDWIRQLNHMATQGLKPDLTLWLDLPLELALRRIQDHRQQDRMEQEERTFHERVLIGFQSLAAAEPHRIYRVDASGSEEEVTKQIQDRLKPYLRHR
jgi:dTMP kinase